MSYQISVALEMGVWLTISGATNSGVPYLLYCGSLGVNFKALPKSQIRIWSLLRSAMRMFSGCNDRKKCQLGLRSHSDVVDADV